MEATKVQMYVTEFTA